MNRVQGKRILITGASSGIGAATASRLAGAGADLALWARRGDRLHRLAEELAAAHDTAVSDSCVDVRDRDSVAVEASRLIDAGWVPDVLINNAGLASGLSTVQNGDLEDWDRMIDTNVKGLLFVTRAFLPAMIERDRGHVVNIGSTAGYQVYPKGNVYNASKFAVRALTEGTNLDVAGTALRVSSINPGFVQTEFATVRFHGDQEKAESVYDGFKPLTGEDVADVIYFVLNAPEHVNVADLLLLPTAQRNVYIVHREGGE